MAQRRFMNAMSFNQSLNSWDTSEVRNMDGMFRDAVLFNRSLNRWNVRAVYTAKRMFLGAVSFDQDLGSWIFCNLRDEQATDDFLTGTAAAKRPDGERPKIEGYHRKRSFDLESLLLNELL